MKNNQYRGKSTQGGASVPLVLIFLAMTAMFFLIGFKLYPAFFEHWQIQSVVESFENDNAIGELSHEEMARRFRVRMQTNNVRAVSFRDAIEIVREDGIITIYIDYESRVNIYKNVDAVIVFKEETEIFL